jgi:hypothetical protein
LLIPFATWKNECREYFGESIMRSTDSLVVVIAQVIVMLFATAPAGSQTAAVDPAVAEAIRA